MVAFGLGANLHTSFGEPERTLRCALAALSAILEEPHAASLYRSAPQSPVAQPEFLNTALVGVARLPPAALLAVAKRLEWAAGRRPGPRWGPRPLDVDLLVYDDLVTVTPELVLPHPRLAQRRFVLVPLAEVAPDLAVPPDGTTVAQLLARSGDRTAVERLR